MGGRGRMGGREKRGRGEKRVERGRRTRCDGGSQMHEQWRQAMEGRGKRDGRRKGGKR